MAFLITTAIAPHGQVGHAAPTIGFFVAYPKSDFFPYIFAGTAGRAALASCAGSICGAASMVNSRIAYTIPRCIRFISSSFQDVRFGLRHLKRSNPIVRVMSFLSTAPPPLGEGANQYSGLSCAIPYPTEVVG